MVGWPGALKISYLLMRWLFGLVVLVCRGDGSKEAELLVVRHEIAVLRRRADRPAAKPPIGLGSLRWPRSSRGGGGPGSSR